LDLQKHCGVIITFAIVPILAICSIIIWIRRPRPADESDIFFKSPDIYPRRWKVDTKTSKGVGVEREILETIYSISGAMSTDFKSTEFMSTDFMSTEISGESFANISFSLASVKTIPIVSLDNLNILGTKALKETPFLDQGENL